MQAELTADEIGDELDPADETTEDQTEDQVDETSNDPATPAEPKQRRRAEHHAELLMGLANQSKQSDVDAAEPDDELWDRQKVLEYFGGNKPIHISTLYRGVNSGLYPRPMNVSPNVVRWIPRECRAARKRMLDERGDPKPPPQGRRGRPRGRKAAKSANT